MSAKNPNKPPLTIFLKPNFLNRKTSIQPPLFDQDEPLVQAF